MNSQINMRGTFDSQLEKRRAKNRAYHAAHQEERRQYLVEWRRKGGVRKYHQRIRTATDLRAKLLSFISETGLGGCWIWTGARISNEAGQVTYGIIYHHGYWSLAHRVAYALLVDEIPDGMFVCHHCDNPPCCNPAHLFIGDTRDNARDMVVKGRHRSQHRLGA